MTLNPDRLFDPNPAQKSAALELYQLVVKKPIYSPHSHLNPELFSNPNYHFGNPVELFIQPDHYVIRMLYSQGISYERILKSENSREVWKLFAENYYLYQGTPTGIWLTHEMQDVFGVTEKLTVESADRIYDQIAHTLTDVEFTPRNLYKRFNIAVIATTDSAMNTLEHHQAIRASDWEGRVIPTFRPDGLINLNSSDWIKNLQILGQVIGKQIGSYKAFIQALEERRAYFKALGATSADVSPAQPTTKWFAPSEMETIFQRALHGKSTTEDAVNFSAHMLTELARMSVEDGLVMQMHPAIFRNHNPHVMQQFGPDTGFDFPVRTEFTRGLKPLLDLFGNHPNFTLILFSLDESALSRELAPMAGAYPAVKLGPPWWFLDSWNGMRRFFDQVMETTGIYNTVGFNDDTRGLLSIPARHDVWRRASANWLAGLLVRGVIDLEDAETMIHELSDGLVKKAYRL